MFLYIKIWKKSIPLQLSPITDTFVLADGSQLGILGEIVLEGRIGHPMTLVVAEFGDNDAILGLDFMEDHDVILRLSLGKMMIGSETVILYREIAEKGCYRISLGNTLTIPARSCKVVEVEVDMGKTASSDEVPRERLEATGECLVESLPTLADMNGIAMGSQLVEFNQNKVLVNLINFHDKPVNMNKGKTVGSIQPVRSVSLIESSGKAEHNKNSNVMLTLNNLPEHTQAVLVGAKLTAEQTSDTCHLILEDPDRFVGPDGKTGNTEWARHGVDVHSAALLKVSYTGIPRAKQHVADEQVEKMLEQGIIEPNDSPWTFPTVLVTKRDGSIRFCVDYRKLNSLSRKDSYPLPCIDETLNTLGGNKLFCTMDLHSGYWQVNMEEADKPKTAFRTWKGLCQFKVMPFGISNSPSTFQRLMDKVLRGLQWEKCLVYLDNIIVFGKTFSETLDNLRCVMQRLKAVNLKLKTSKCQWFRQSVKYLGHIVSKDGIACEWDLHHTIVNSFQFFLKLHNHWLVWPWNLCNLVGVRTVKKPLTL